MQRLGSRRPGGGGEPVTRLIDDAMCQLFDNSLDGIVITGPDTVITHVNTAYERIVGYPREHLIGKPVSVVKSGKTPPETFTDMWRQLKTSGRWIGELINRRRNGEEWYGFLSITKLVGDDGSVLGYVGIIRDITDRERTERMLVQKLRELAVTQEITVKTLALLSEHKDPDISGHLDRIQSYARLLARELAGAGDHPEAAHNGFVERMAQTSVLHDVGKVAIPEGILFKPAKLNMEEFQVMQLHTRIGGQILGGADEQLRSSLGLSETFLTMAKEIALHHHERWDGQGYPDKLREEEIPLAARIVAVADVYDALTSRRVYKPAWTHAQARETIVAASGRQFDPAVVNAFLRQEEAFDQIRSRAGGQEGF